MNVQQELFLERFGAAVRRDGWYRGPRAAGTVFFAITKKQSFKRVDLLDAINHAYRRESKANSFDDRLDIMDLYDLTIGEPSASPALRTIFNTLQTAAEKERAEAPDIGLKKQFASALRRVKDAAYAEFGKTGSSPLHKGVTQVFREVTKNLPKDISNFTHDAFVQEIERFSLRQAHPAPRRSIHQAADVMWAVLQVVRPY